MNIIKTALTIVFLASFTYHTQGADVTRELSPIEQRIQEILQTNKPDQRTTRENLCFQFKKFINNDRKFANAILDDNAILKLRDIVRNIPNNILDILIEDLDDPDFGTVVSNRLMRSELTNYASEIKDRNGLHGLVVYICDESSKVQLTGTLIPVPVDISPTIKVIKWHVLTSAHLLNAMPKEDTPNFGIFFHRCDVHGQIQASYRIAKIKVYKRPGRNVHIDDLPPNTMSLIDVKAKLSIDKEGDIALCEIVEEDNTHELLTFLFLADKNSVKWIGKDMLHFVLQDNSQCYVHLISNGVTAQQNVLPKNNKFLLGYKLWTSMEPPKLIVSKKRRGELRVFKHDNSMDSTQINNFNFFIDLPSYHGMSGGPIFFMEGTNLAPKYHIFGVTTAIHRDTMLTQGAFIQPGLFFPQ